ncbi:hypothetical protein [Pseudonocardia sp. ICBG601]|uniref:hypothetical protein n=1 Tax=Pseudonocardia sp. ICBG601 TaxID=2846759 RepID=UPI001CF70913|nr:hypothetical protein [Pseudonocardia sp. ICBG601]
MINYLTFPDDPATIGVSGLRWDDADGGYRCPTCARTPRALVLGSVEAFVCSDCAAYWLAPTVAGRRDFDAAEDVYREAGCLDSSTGAGNEAADAGSAVSAVARAA